MAITTRSSSSSNFGGLTNAPSFSSVAAVTGDWIYAAWAWRGTGGGGGTNVVFSTAPTWNGQSFTQVGSTVQMIAADAGTLQLAVYRVKAATSTTANIVAAMDQFANMNGGYSVKIGVDPTTPNDTPVTQGIFATWSNPSINIANMTSNDEIFEVFADIGWDVNFDDRHLTTWNLANTQTNVFNQLPATDAAGFPQLRYDTKTGTGTVTVGYTPSANQPGYVHFGIRLIGASSGTPAAVFTGTANSSSSSSLSARG